ncbi:Endocuticle structural protein SgAbd-6 [Frankliniella fusca]|uniref:Endocuticle structural protein SgAbd-6 n=1 Tax=Frankliniella fusca TaxID=407009 RepID=A0AAE1HUN9_9NEOP|nr:Endocuticle structural protein SgAbd-6 [Frankliniella fusca]
MNVPVLVLMTAVVAVAALLVAPVSGAAYTWLYPADLNMSNVATTSTTVAPPPSGSTPTTLEAAAATTTATAAATTPAPGPREPTPEEEKDCESQIGVIENGVHISTMRKYDMAKILEEHGGAPGKLNVTWNKDVPELPVEDPTVSPLPDTDNTTYWVYNYKSTDFKTYVRLEHGLLRNKGQKDEYVDVRGELYWTPPDFCNKARHATYRVNQTGFASDVRLESCTMDPQYMSCISVVECWSGPASPYGPHKACGVVAHDVSFEYCTLEDGTLRCETPANCFVTEDSIRCVMAPSSALIASLVG